MFKEFYGEHRGWALGRIGGGRDTEEERVGDGSLNKVGIFCNASLCTIFFPTFFVHGSLFSLIEPFTTINWASHLFNVQH